MFSPKNIYVSNIIQPEQVVFICVYVCMCIYTHICMYKHVISVYVR